MAICIMALVSSWVSGYLLRAYQRSGQLCSAVKLAYTLMYR